jgi:hypothetical protein
MRGFLMLAVMALFAAPALAGNGMGGAEIRWLPPNPGETAEAAQIVRNEEYFSIKIHAVHLYYRAGPLKNLKNLVVMSDLVLTTDEGRTQGAMVNGAYSRDDREYEQLLPMADHIAMMCPSTPTNVKVQLRVRGMGEQKYRRIFDILSSADIKPLGRVLTAAAPGIGAAASLVSRFMDSPYTDENPKNVLDVVASFNVYPRTDIAAAHADALRDGYLVVVTPLPEADGVVAPLPAEGDLRLSPQGQQKLEYRENGEWRELKDQTYVIFNVVRCPIKGENQSSPWFRKYAQAMEIVSALPGMDSADCGRALDDALTLWRDGNVLLDADPYYIYQEKKAIRAKYLNVIREARETAAQQVHTMGNPETPALPDVAPAARDDLPADYATLAASYDRLVSDYAGDLWVQLAGELKGLGGGAVTITAADDPAFKQERSTDDTGRVNFEGLLPGAYLLSYADPASAAAPAMVVIDPKATSEVTMDAAPGAD